MTGSPLIVALSFHPGRGGVLADHLPAKITRRQHQDFLNFAESIHAHLTRPLLAIVRSRDASEYIDCRPGVECSRAVIQVKRPLVAEDLHFYHGDDA